MNPLLQAALGSILRWVLTAGASYLVAKGVWTQDEASGYVGAAVVAVLMLLWSLWTQYAKNRLINTALAMPGGATRNEANKVIAAGMAPPASVAASDAPFLVGQANPQKTPDDPA